MKTFLLSAFLVFASAAFSANLPKDCYQTVDGGQFCTTDNVGKVQVYIFNAGWCPSCNEEMDEMPAVFEQFKGQPVVFASLSGEGWSSGEEPNASFLRAWQQKHDLPEGFVVAGKYEDFGNDFQPTGYIPFTAILDKEGNLVKHGSISASQIEAQVRRLLAK